MFIRLLVKSAISDHEAFTLFNIDQITCIYPALTKDGTDIIPEKCYIGLNSIPDAIEVCHPLAVVEKFLRNQSWVLDL